MKKKSSLIFFLFVLSFSLGERSTLKDFYGNWKTYRKGKDKRLYSLSSQSIKKNLRRSPAAFNKEKSLEERKRKRRGPRRWGRLLVGSEASQFFDSQKKLNLINHFNPQWDRLVGENLLRHRSLESQVSFKQVGSYIQVNGDRGRLVEKIVVTSLGGHKSHFNALVDSQTGEILVVFNRTIYENLAKRQRPSWSPRPLKP